MNVFVAPKGHELGKFSGVISAFPQVWNGTILDVGCRSTRFGELVTDKCKSYLGLDLTPPADLVGNLEGGLPFRNCSFDTTVALDVLEHTNDIHRSFAELARITNKQIVVSLPNMFEFRGRVKILLGKQVSGKYGLPVNPTIDRHRWFFSFAEASHFCRTWGAKCGFRVDEEGCLVGPKRFSLLGQNPIKAWPDLFAPTYLALLAREKNCQSTDVHRTAGYV